MRSEPEVDFLEQVLLFSMPMFPLGLVVSFSLPLSPISVFSLLM